MARGDNDAPRVNNTLVAVIILLVVSLLLCVWYSHESSGGFLHGLQNGFNVINRPASSVGVQVGESVDNAVTSSENARATDEELSELEARVAELEAEVALNEEYRLECERLQNMLALVNMYDIQGVSGRVVARSSEPYNKEITVNVGSSSGVEIGNTVIGSAGVIGQVTAVQNGSCTVRLITDQQSGVSVLIQYNRKEGIVRGSLEGLLYLEDVDSDVVVQIGDVLVTSGLGGSYTRGLIVGQVIRVTASVGDSSRLIVVSPVDDVDGATEVFIVKSMGSYGAAA